MFEEWGAMEWFILVVDVLALYVVVRFLRNKVKHKLNEVEARQRHHLIQRRKEAQERQDPSKNQ